MACSSKLPPYVSVALATCLAILFATSVFSNGNRARKDVYTAKAQGYSFSMEIEPILFELNTVQNRYRVLRIRIVSATATDLPLSSQNDRVTLVGPIGDIPGILSLPRQDPMLWKS